MRPAHDLGHARRAILDAGDQAGEGPAVPGRASGRRGDGWRSDHGRRAVGRDDGRRPAAAGAMRSRRPAEARWPASYPGRSTSSVCSPSSGGGAARARGCRTSGPETRSGGIAAELGMVHLGEEPASRELGVLHDLVEPRAPGRRTRRPGGGARPTRRAGASGRAGAARSRPGRARRPGVLERLWRSSRPDEPAEVRPELRLERAQRHVPAVRGLVHAVAGPAAVQPLLPGLAAPGPSRSRRRDAGSARTRRRPSSRRRRTAPGRTRAGDGAPRAMRTRPSARRRPGRRPGHRA